jgi:hypothetical protein
MRYITITARHHDGFSMFASKTSRYNMDRWLNDLRVEQVRRYRPDRGR